MFTLRLQPVKKTYLDVRALANFTEIKNISSITGNETRTQPNDFESKIVIKHPSGQDLTGAITI